MRVFISGATGFIGEAVVRRLQHDGHTVVAWVRSPSGARERLGAGVELLATSASHEALTAAMDRCDAVVNLAGAPILGRWTAARRRALEDSRVGVTDRLVHAIRSAASPPSVMVSGSAVGYYGDRGDEPLLESSGPGTGFLAELGQRWEASALKAEAAGTRVVLLRTSVALGRVGGALKTMLPAFRLGLGGPVGPGTQYFPWIHLSDLVAIIATALVDVRYRGPVNAAAPEAVTSRAFGRALGRALGRPAVLPLPAFVLRIVFGRAATVLLASQRQVPRALEEWGFAFEFPTLDAALRDIVGGRVSGRD